MVREGGPSILPRGQNGSPAFARHDAILDVIRIGRDLRQAAPAAGRRIGVSDSGGATKSLLKIPVNESILFR